MRAAQQGGFFLHHSLPHQEPEEMLETTIPEATLREGEEKALYLITSAVPAAHPDASQLS